MLSGKLVLLTGSTGVIGKEIALGLVKQGNEVILPYRNQLKANEIESFLKSKVPECKIHLEYVDFESLQSLHIWLQEIPNKYPSKFSLNDVQYLLCLILISMI